LRHRLAKLAPPPFPVRPASFRTIRGVTAVAAVCDEIAFWRSDDSANPDREILKALRPALATTGGLLACISSPHAKRGELYNTYRRHFGPAGDPRILVAKAPSRTMNPSLPASVVERAYAEDPEAASAEYGGEFRGDLAVFVGRETLDAATEIGVTVRAPVEGVAYVGFVDPSGGSSDSMTLAIAHAEGARIALDFIGERKAPFSPASAVEEFAGVLKQYRLSRVRGDRYAGEWPREAFASHGVAYEVSPLNRSELYLATLPLLNSGRAALLDNARMASQFLALERRTSRAGKDSVDHPPGAHDDVANAVAGALTMATGASEPGWLVYVRREVGVVAEDDLYSLMNRKTVRLLAPTGCGAVRTLSGRDFAIPADRIIEVDEEDARALRGAGFTDLKRDAA
jgi:hypothetical protein